MLTLQDPTLLKTQSYLNGSWHDASAYFSVHNPADGSLLAEVADGGVEHCQLAIAAASQSQADWAARPAAERARLLRRWFELLLNHQEDLARLMTAEQGKPLAEARAEVVYGASYIEWFAEEAKRLYGDTIPAPSGDKRLLVIRQPVGVVAAITPWNFPNAMITRKAAPALAAGCSIVVRPAELTPLSALALAELANRAGIPAGVFNVVTGADAKAMGEVLTRHPAVNKFSFTGSTAVGKQLISQCADSVKRVSMELGGNAPFIVFSDADLDAAVAGAIASKFRNAGQTCVCANRLLVQQDIYTEFANKLVSAVHKLQLGRGDKEGVHVGPMIHARAAARVNQLVQDALAQGATCLTGGPRTDLGDNYVAPTILCGVSNQMAVAQQEIFGPVAPLIAFNDEAEAIALANDTEMGLAAYCYTRDIGRALRMGERLAYGMVGLNEGIISNVAAPFGGIKASGNGREGSKYGLDEYTEIKYLCLGGIEQF
ncbi:NADP-dependent succinate-semialdehyde dehydrogenase [Bowmanella denitrificans]|uniref:NADP-dependent succinate-semialdehyde dehydrogenase n=1 Tax=Bowmanella denitrificans TaxID=366582 RepID=A0ABN0WLK7_9ALTE